MTVQRVTMSTDADGNEVAEVTNMISAGTFVSSADHVGPGITVKDGIGTKTVTAADQLAGHEIITVQGMEIKVSQARELGLLDQVFDPSKAHAHQQEQDGLHPQAQQDAPKQPQTEYQSAEAAVEQMVAAASMTAREAQSATTAIAQIEMAGMEIGDFYQIAQGVESGEASSLDIGDNLHDTISGIIENTKAAATASAMAELGPESFAKLQEIAKLSPEVSEAVKGYAMRRMTGQADNLTWTDLFNEAGSFMRGQ